MDFENCGEVENSQDNDPEEDLGFNGNRRLLRKQSARTKRLCAKEERNATIKRVSLVLQKSEQDHTSEEKDLLNEYSDIVKEVKSRWKKRDEAKRRLEEYEEPHEEMHNKCIILAQAIAQSQHLVVYTGAGISTAARIPDYRGTNGIWTRLQQGKDIGNHDLSLAEPTYTHMALSELYKRNKLKYVVSQNCDGLHLRSGLPRTAISEVHGNMYIEVCKNCKPAREYWRMFDVTENTARYSHKTMRKCYHCNGSLVDTIVHFGERGSLQWPLNWSGASKNAKKATTILCLGSSLKVLKKYPWLWQMHKPVKRRPNLYIVNLQWTPKDDCANVKINGKCDVVMKTVMNLLGIEVPEYDRNKDPIFAHGTPLSEPELHTTTQPFLKDITTNEIKKEEIDEDKRKVEINEKEQVELLSNKQFSKMEEETDEMIIKKEEDVKLELQSDLTGCDKLNVRETLTNHCTVNGAKEIEKSHFYKHDETRIDGRITEKLIEQSNCKSASEDNSVMKSGAWMKNGMNKNGLNIIQNICQKNTISEETMEKKDNKEDIPTCSNNTQGMKEEDEKKRVTEVNEKRIEKETNFTITNLLTNFNCTKVSEKRNNGYKNLGVGNNGQLENVKTNEGSDVVEKKEKNNSVIIFNKLEEDYNQQIKETENMRTVEIINNQVDVNKTEQFKLSEKCVANKYTNMHTLNQLDKERDDEKNDNLNHHQQKTEELVTKEKCDVSNKRCTNFYYNDQLKTNSVYKDYKSKCYSNTENNLIKECTDIGAEHKLRDFIYSKSEYQQNIVDIPHSKAHNLQTQSFDSSYCNNSEIKVEKYPGCSNDLIQTICNSKQQTPMQFDLHRRKPDCSFKIMNVDFVKSKTRMYYEDKRNIKIRKRTQFDSAQHVSGSENKQNAQNYLTSKNCDINPLDSNIYSIKGDDTVGLNLTLPKKSMFSIDSILNRNQEKMNCQAFLNTYYHISSALYRDIHYPFQTSLLYSGLHSIINPLPLINAEHNYSVVKSECNDAAGQNGSYRYFNTVGEKKYGHDGSGKHFEVRNAVGEKYKYGTDVKKCDDGNNKYFEIRNAAGGYSLVKSEVCPILEPSCVYCHENYTSFSCLFYKKCEPTFLKQQFRYSKVEKMEKPLYCVCCDYTTDEEEEDEEMVEEEKGPSSPSPDKICKVQDEGEPKVKIQPGWFGKGYRKNRKYKKKIAAY